MKKIRHIFLVILSIGLLSCTDDFVDILPYGKVIPNNTDDLAKLLNESTYINGVGRYSADIYLRVDDYTRPQDKLSSWDLQTIKLYTWRDFLTQTEYDFYYNLNYQIIAIANFVLEHIDHYPKGERFKIENTKGRALFLRANAYFFLINAYAKMYNAATAGTDLGVPLPLEMNINEKLPRSTVQQAYDLIIKDLKQAVTLLDPKFKYNTWPCKAAAYALLGRVYLYQKKYAKSAENSKQALELYSALTDYNTFAYKEPKSKNPAAGISGYEDDLQSNKELLFYYKTTGYVLSGLYISASLINAYDKENDLRFRYFISDRDQAGTDLKGVYITVNTQMVFGWAGITTSEVYLNYCEALIRGPSQMQESLTWLNKLRKNRYDASTYVPYQSADPATALKEVMLERRRELRFTFWRWVDMKRLGVSCTRTVNGKTYTLKATSNNYVWAIPLNVMAMNPLLKQNPRGL